MPQETAVRADQKEHQKYKSETKMEVRATYDLFLYGICTCTRTKAFVIPNPTRTEQYNTISLASETSCTRLGVTISD